MSGAVTDKGRRVTLCAVAVAAFIVLISGADIDGWADAALFLTLKAVSGSVLYACARAYTGLESGKGADDGR